MERRRTLTWESSSAGWTRNTCRDCSVTSTSGFSLMGPQRTVSVSPVLAVVVVVVLGRLREMAAMLPMQ